MLVTYESGSPVPSHGFLVETPPRLLPIQHPSRAAHYRSRDHDRQFDATFVRRVRASKPLDKRYDIRDDVVTGLMLRVIPSGTRTYTIEGAVHGRRLYANIGDPVTLTVPQARRGARRLIANFVEPVKIDNGPRAPRHPMTAFAEEFLDRQAHRWKPRIRATNTHIVQKYMLPTFGGW